MALLTKGAIAAVAVAAGLAAGATGIALADNTSSPTTTAAPTARPPGAPDGVGPGGHFGGRGMRGGPGMGMGMGGALHGVLVVPAPSGGYQTVLVQRGKVTAISSTSITLTSADGFTSTYAVTADTMVNAARDGIASIKKGADANVLAVQKAGKATALHIGDRSLQKQFRDEFRGPEGTKPSTAPTA